MEESIKEMLKAEVNHILDNIKNIRIDKKLSQENMATEMGCDTSTYSKIENGKIDLTANRLAQLAHVFSLRMVDIIAWPEVLINVKERPEHKRVKAILQVELDQEKKDQVIKLVFGENILEILNR